MYVRKRRENNLTIENPITYKQSPPRSHPKTPIWELWDFSTSGASDNDGDTLDFKVGRIYFIFILSYFILFC